MTNSYTQKLRKWVQKREPIRQRKDKNIVAFLAVRADVKEALKEGYAIHTIWEHMHETKKIPYGYRTFLNHVRLYIKEEDTKRRAAPKSPPISEEKTTAQEKETSLSKIKEFVFNTTPKREELF